MQKKQGIEFSSRAAKTPQSRSQEMSASLSQEAGARAIIGEAKVIPTRSLLEPRPLPHYRDAPKGARVIESGPQSVMLAKDGFYLGLFSTT